MNNNVVTNTKKTINSMTSYLSNISLDIFILVLIIVQVLNNLDRFSNRKEIFNIESNKSVFILALVSALLGVLLIYCKTLTVLNNSSLISKIIPVLFIFIPFVVILSIIYIDTQKKISDDKLNHDENKNQLPFTTPPNFILPKTLRIIVNIFLLIFNCLLLVV